MKKSTKNKVDQRLSAWKTITLFLVMTFLGMQSATAQYTVIPDSNFEHALFTLGIDTIDGDYQVLTSAISDLTSLDLSSKNITDLTGIQDFTSLQTLTCYSNQLSSLNVSNLTNLQTLACYNNQLTSLNMGGLVNLQTLQCAANKLTVLSVSGLTNLSYLDCNTNQLSSLNVSGLTNLLNLDCRYNQLMNLDISGLTNNFMFLSCSYNQLTNLTLSDYTNLQTIYCNNNQLTSLNISNLPNLTYLYCGSNLNLSCITVSDPMAATSHSSWYKDTTASYATNCNPAPTANTQTYCQGATVANLIATGTFLHWYTTASGGTTLDNSTTLSTGTYYVSQTVNTIESARTSVVVTVNPNVTPTFTVVSPICSGTSLSALPTISTNSITGTWSPALNNTQTTTYTFTPTAGQCATTTTLDIIVNPNSNPTFTAIAPICSGVSLSALPTTSNNSITGTWSPALNNTQTTTYTFTPTAGQCATTATLTITVTPNSTPTFTAVAPIYAGGSLSALPTTSNNSYTGTWSPALNNTATTTYTFTPDAGQCATTATLTINVYPVISLVSDGSNQSTQFSGWNYNLGNNDYPMTTTDGVNYNISSVFLTGAAGASGYSSPYWVKFRQDNSWLTNWGSSAFPSGTGVHNGENICVFTPGNYSVSFNIATGAYAFTLLSPAPVVSVIGATIGTPWTTDVDLTVTDGVNYSLSSYNLTAGELKFRQDHNWSINWGGNSFPTATGVSYGNNIVASPSGDYNISFNRLTQEYAFGLYTAIPMDAISQSFCGTATVANLIPNDTSKSWYADATGGTALASDTVLTTGTYYVAQTVNGIESNRTSISVTVTPNSTPTFSTVTSICSGASLSALPTTSTNGYTGTWSPSLNNTTTTTYTFTPDAGQCATTATLTITVNPIITPTFTAVDPIAPGTALSDLPTTSLNGITGTWSPALNTTHNTTYTFTPDAGQCATTTTLDITVQIMICNSGTIANLTPNGSAIKWYLAATGGTKLASTILLTTKLYYYTETIGGIEGPRNAVSVVVNKPTAPTSSNQTFCLSATVADLVATGSNILWYSTGAGGSTLDPSTPIASGNYYASQTVNGCESIARKAVAVRLNVTATPIAPATQTFCYGAKVSNLGATGTSLKWYPDATGGTALPTTTLLSSGTYYVSQTITACESLRAAVTVIVNTTPSPIASLQSLPSGSKIGDLVATGTSIKWYTAATGGTALASTTLLSSGTYYASQTLNGCESARTAVAVVINVTPAPNASAQTLCNGATIADLIAPGLNIKWYVTATGGSPIASTYILVTKTYYVSQTVNGIESARTAVPVTINTTPAPWAAFQAFTFAATVANLVATGTDIKWYATATGGTPLNAATPLVSGALYYCSQTLNGCESARRAIGVRVAVALIGNSTNTAIAKTVTAPTEFTIYPNPVSNILSIQTSNDNTIDKVVVIDLYGKVILEETPINNQIKVEQFPTGTYIIQISSGEEKFLTKFIKE